MLCAICPLILMDTILHYPLELVVARSYLKSLLNVRSKNP